MSAVARHSLHAEAARRSQHRLTHSRTRFSYEAHSTTAWVLWQDRPCARRAPASRQSARARAAWRPAQRRRLPGRSQLLLLAPAPPGPTAAHIRQPARTLHPHRLFRTARCPRRPPPAAARCAGRGPPWARTGLLGAAAWRPWRCGRCWRRRRRRTGPWQRRRRPPGRPWGWQAGSPAETRAADAPAVPMVQGKVHAGTA